MEHDIIVSCHPINCFGRIIGNETVTSRLTSIFVDHQLRINDSTKFFKIISEFFRGDISCDTTHKHLTNLFLFIFWDSSLWVNQLTVKNMLFSQNGINTITGCKGQKGETSGLTSTTISHDICLKNLTIFTEVLFQSIFVSFPVQTTNEKLSNILIRQVCLHCIFIIGWNFNFSDIRNVCISLVLVLNITLILILIFNLALALILVLILVLILKLLILLIL